MEIYNKGDRSGYEEIVSYGPSWWPEFREMDAVYRYEGWLLDLKFHLLNRMTLNLFPSQADEEAIAAWEKLLKIEYNPDLTLEQRRKTVQAYYSGTGHLSRSEIIRLIASYTGMEGDVVLETYGDDGRQRLRIIVKSGEDDDVVLDALLDLLERCFPAHLVYVVDKTILIELDNLNAEKFILMNINFHVSVSFWDARIWDGTWPLDGSYFLNGYRRFPVAVRLLNRFPCRQISEGVDVSVLTKSPDCWFWNGEYNLDGKRIMNAIYEKEAVE